MTSTVCSPPPSAASARNVSASSHISDASRSCASCAALGQVTLCISPSQRAFGFAHVELIILSIAPLRTSAAGSAAPLMVSRTVREALYQEEGDAAGVRGCLEAGADHFFDKSAELDRVLDVLRNLAETGEA